MTSRERFRETMAYGSPDRVPYFEEGIRDEVLAAWREQGLPPDADLTALFQTDWRERIPVNVGLTGESESPAYEIPLTELRARLDPADPSRFPADWPELVRGWRDREHVLELPLHSGFFLAMGVRDWRTFAPAVLMMTDEPDRVHALMDAYGELSAAVAERVLSEVDVDFATFSEPIGGNDGPLLSPRQYETFVLRSYRPILDVLRRHGVHTICLVTYANARPLIPSILKFGFNCLWACEVNTEAMNYLDLRREFGRDLRLIGGIDLDVLLLDEESIRRAIEETVPSLLAEGGYIPLADGRVRGNIPFARYVAYRRALERVTAPGPASSPAV